MIKKLIILSVACLFSVIGISPIQADDELLFWHDHYGEALADAKESDKPILLSFR